MVINTLRRLTLLAVLSALIAGCATIAEPELPTSSVDSGRARISGDSETAHKFWKGLDQRVFITKLDGKSQFRLSLTSDYPQTVIVVPGRHYLDVQYRLFNMFANGKLWLDAEAGKSYLIKKKQRQYAVSLWIEEADSGRVVGGVPGGEPTGN